MQERSLADLTRDFAGQLGDLFRKEVRLARAEALDGVKNMGRGLMTVALGIAFAAGAVTLGLFALAAGLAEMMPLWGGAPIAALVGAGVGYALVQSGRKALAHEPIKLPRTARQVQEDIRLIKEKAPS
jgi:predicted PurR-regulated permease PerM